MEIAPLLTSVIEIHVQGSEFSLNAYLRDPSPQNLERLIETQKNVNRRIREALAHGKPSN